MNEAVSVVLDPAGENVYVGSEVGPVADDWLAVFSRNSATGALTFLQSFDDDAVSFDINCSGVGPSDSAVAVSPDGLFVAVSSPFRGGLATFSRAANGTLTFVEAICDDIFVLGDQLGSIVDLATSADGLNLYSAGGAFSILNTIDYACGVPDVHLALPSDTVGGVETETACKSIEFQDTFGILETGELTLETPLAIVRTQVTVEGVLTVTPLP